MPSKRFTKFGLKRSNNLSDIPNERLALNNILDGLKGDKELFVSEDLDCIRGLFPFNITPNDFQQIADNAVKTTSSTGEFEVFKPLVTIENRFDRAYFTVSDPFFYGGDGLTARYYDNIQISRDGNGNFTGFTGTETLKNNFWEKGRFAFEDKLTNNNLSLFGGIEWSGLYKPTISGVYSFDIDTDGFYTFEFNSTPLPIGTLWDDRGGSYVEYGAWTESTRNINVTIETGNAVVQVTNQSDMKYIMTGMSLSTGFGQDVIISSVNEGNQEFTMSGVATSEAINTDVTFSKEPGVSGSKRFYIGTLEQYKAYPIRIRYFVDEASIPPNANVTKIFNIRDIDPFGGDGNNLRYTNLYDEKYFDGYFIGDFKNYIDNSISSGGTEVDGSGTLGKLKDTIDGDNYIDVNSLESISSNYLPPKIISDVEVSRSSITRFANSPTLSFSITDDLMIGMYVQGTGIPVGTRISDVIFQEGVILDANSFSSGSNQTATFVDHRGLVSYGVYTSSTGNTILGTTFQINSSRIRPGQVVVGNFYTSTNWARIIDYDESTGTILTSQPLNVDNSGGNIYVYYDSALVNQSLEAFCENVYAKRIVPPSGQSYDYTYPSGATQITLEDTSGLTNGMYAHLIPKTPFSQLNVTGGIENRSNASITVVGNTVTLSQGLVQSITVTNSVITNMTFSPTAVNKEICFVPTDTAPPFNANSEGLTTPKSIKMVTADNITPNTSAQLTYNDLELIIPTADVLEVNTNSDSVSHTLPILDSNNIPFQILLGS